MSACSHVLTFPYTPTPVLQLPIARKKFYVYFFMRLLYFLSSLSLKDSPFSSLTLQLVNFAIPIKLPIPSFLFFLSSLFGCADHLSRDDCKHLHLSFTTSIALVPHLCICLHPLASILPDTKDVCLERRGWQAVARTHRCWHGSDEYSQRWVCASHAGDIVFLFLFRWLDLTFHSVRTHSSAHLVTTLYL